MFYIIGLGLCDEKDITVRGLEVGNASDPPQIFSHPNPGSQKLIASIPRSIHQHPNGAERTFGTTSLLTSSSHVVLTGAHP